MIIYAGCYYVRLRFPFFFKKNMISKFDYKLHEFIKIKKKIFFFSYHSFFYF